MSQFKPNKRRKLSPPNERSSNGVKPTSAKRPRGKDQEGEWDLEHAYAGRVARLKGKESNRLPIKTAEGWVPAKEEEQPLDTSDKDSFLASEGSDDDNNVDKLEELEEPGSEKSQRQQIIEAKEELARLAALVNEDPEEHLASLKALTRIAASRNSTVKKLALATQCAVYKDIIPGYRIRPYTEEEMSAKVSKEVRKLRAYEQALVTGYSAYLKDLEKLATGSKDYPPQESASLASVAYTCVCTLLQEVPHFNFRGDLIKVIVSKLSKRKLDQDFTRCLRAMEQLFENDEDGRTSMDAVTQLTKMIKARNYAIHEDVLNTFLHLRLLSEFRSKASNDRVDKSEEEQQAKISKKNRQFLTKRARKERKERKALDKELKEADAVVSYEEREKNQAEMLKLVFATYFRILKVKFSPLMGAVLEGLARYAHLINQDFFGDILEALKDLLNDMDRPPQEEGDSAENTVQDDEEEEARNVTRESLLCAITAFALLEGQDMTKAASTLHLDLNFFIARLYRDLQPATLNADIELGPKSLRLVDPLGDNNNETRRAMKVNAQTTTVLLIRCLSSVLLPPSAIRSVPPVRLAAFTKQLMSASLQLPEKSCLAMLSLLTSVAKVHGRKISSLWNTEERRGDGVFDATRPEFESSNPFAATIWEGELLRLHYCPKIREQVKAIEKNIKEAH